MKDVIGRLPIPTVRPKDVGIYIAILEWFYGRWLLEVKKEVVGLDKPLETPMFPNYTTLTYCIDPFDGIDIEDRSTAQRIAEDVMGVEYGFAWVWRDDDSYGRIVKMKGWMLIKPDFAWVWNKEGDKFKLTLEKVEATDVKWAGGKRV